MGAGRGSSRQEEQDEALARALQAQEYHSRTRGRPPAPHGDYAEQRIPGHEERQRARDEQLRMAIEVNPEAFVHVPMLYVRCTLNNVALRAFVDTGAQMTVMTLDCAKKCNLASLIDQRFRGVASGVGVAKITGRVHMATLRFGRNAAVDVTITVLDKRGGPELLLGLDLLRKYSAHVNLEHNVLIIGGERIPFVDKDGK